MVSTRNFLFWNKSSNYTVAFDNGGSVTKKFYLQFYNENSKDFTVKDGIIIICLFMFLICSFIKVSFGRKLTSHYSIHQAFTDVQKNVRITLWINVIFLIWVSAVMIFKSLMNTFIICVLSLISDMVIIATNIAILSSVTGVLRNKMESLQNQPTTKSWIYYSKKLFVIATTLLIHVITTVVIFMYSHNGKEIGPIILMAFAVLCMSSKCLYDVLHIIVFDYFIQSINKNNQYNNTSLENSDVANSNAVKLSEEENHVVIRLKENIVQVATNISEKAAKWKILQLLMISLILVAIWFLLYTDVFSLYETLCFMTQIEIYVPQTSAYKSLQNTISIYINLLIVACLISLLAPLTFLFVLDAFYLLERGKIFEKPL